MTDKFAFIKAMIPDVPLTDNQISAYLDIAADKILQRVYPFGGTPSELPMQYDMIQCQLVVRMVARAGGEGEISHSENGIVRMYASADDEDILKQLTPYVGVK